LSDTASGLRGRELAIWRSERCLFEGLDFSLQRTQLALVIGANGAGKTSLLRVLAGLASPTAGEVTWDGTPVQSLAADHRAQVAYRGHLDGLKRDLTVVENLKIHDALWEADADLARLLAEVQLERAAHTRVRHLSAGQRRRASLATLRLCGARLWILDEPLTNLDRGGRELMLQWVRAHLQAGGCAVIATHQPEEFADAGTFAIEL
jgi:heme exporter protein A